MNQAKFEQDDRQDHLMPMSTTTGGRDLSKACSEFPHQLFMLNHFGQTPLDIAI
jgi:hypothetical protein